MSSSRIQAPILADRAPLTVNIPPISATSNLIEAGLFLHSGRSNKVAPDLQFLFSPALWVGAAIAPDIPGFTLIPALINPQSRGTVKALATFTPDDTKETNSITVIAAFITPGKPFISAFP